MIQLEKLTRRFAGVTAVDEVSLSVRQGELLVLLGSSGSGKTTTLKMVNRLLEPSSGRIFIDGEDVLDVEVHELRRRIGYVFQKVGLFPHLNIAENIGITPRLLGWPSERVAARVEELLELVELEPALLSRRPDQLSGGQQQRVGVARALAAEPSLMLLDEPFGALDPLTRDRLQQSFIQIRRRLRMTGIFVTHDMSEALLLGDQIGVMRGGRLIQLDTPRQLVQSPADEYVSELMRTPQRQAAIFDALAQGEGR